MELIKKVSFIQSTDNYVLKCYETLKLACLLKRFPCNIEPLSYDKTQDIEFEEKVEKTKNDCLKNVGKILLRGHSQPHLQIQKQNEKVK